VNLASSPVHDPSTLPCTRCVRLEKRFALSEGAARDGSFTAKHRQNDFVRYETRSLSHAAVFLAPPN
jgi:hypothetical protein